MQPHQVRYFLAVVQTLSFTQAAELCAISQPALTKAVQRLEAELGGALFHRERQRTQLTDFGRHVLPTLERALSAANFARVHALEFQRGEISLLRIGLTPCVSALLVSEVLSEVTGILPRLQVELVERPLDELVDHIVGGRVGAAIVGEETEPLPENIVSWPLFEEQFVVLVSAVDPLAQYESIPLDVMADSTWIARSGCKASKDFWRTRFPANWSPRIGHCGQQLGQLHHMVAAGLGIMLAPEHTPRSPLVVSRPISGEPLRRSVRLIAAAQRHATSAVDAFVRVSRARDWRREFEGRGRA